jgi:IrrE N-terminal-like domain
VKEKPPTRWASDIRCILREVLGQEALPVDVGAVAMELSRQWWADDPVSAVRGDNLPGFDGALIPDPAGRKGWLILYNNRIESPGRIVFTLAHEFGHYLQHRARSPQGFHCKGEDFVRWDPAYRKLENEANAFAAGLLMPLDDFRVQVPTRGTVDLEVLRACADRYGVSLIAATLRWLEYTSRRAVLVLSREGFVLWSRASETALRSGLFIKTAGRPPVEVPPDSLTARLVDGPERSSAAHPEGIWFTEECRELVLPSERYDFAISLLLFSDTLPDWETQQSNKSWGLGHPDRGRDTADA